MNQIVDISTKLLANINICSERDCSHYQTIGKQVFDSQIEEPIQSLSFTITAYSQQIKSLDSGKKTIATSRSWESQN